ncbi:protoheme IX farnesyltransferase [Clavispora lusitaniae]|uniref:Protoheme IX farnesyltransferase, mitochondrial n=1 Tax=Clavispora lusitaniae (strain ATCC 42720) TaxID=306902 RepID=C4Y2W0_CLAL4|nr:uncharacterized protein CLUG_02873 [Clavispora lusitaniae ATCC 42720]EEQ38747.1 hypothetical protein CLUG_02873 [Clavispora lusitaniae ATCC 42720]KAF7579878.1 protoheme IX farnesyltransferase [Clavispora lusitaniae]
MSARLAIIPRVHFTPSLNYFYNNSNKLLKLERGFISNQFLSSRRKHIPAERIAEPAHLVYEDKKATSFGEVATKVLSCQDSDARSSQKLTDPTNTKQTIPFPIKPKANTNQKKIRKSKGLLNPYVKLTKPNLTVLVTLSSICSYAISPNSVSITELAFLTLGTALCSGSANAINMGREPEFDKRMMRTSMRPVVTGLVTPRQAYQFALVTGAIGCTILCFGVNPTVSLLGFLNIGLYAWIYTSLKRRSIVNTWVGAVVGAIPPLMGWAASSSLTHPGSWCLAALLYAWQFPHFNALSHNIAEQYKSAGYVMAAAENPKLNARVALRYSLLMFPICFGLSYYGVTDWYFQIDSAIANAWMTVLAYRFWNQQRKNHARGNHPTPEAIQMANFHAKKLFWCSVWQLPAVLILAMLHKKGQWDRLEKYLGFGVAPEKGTELPSI